jgi:predicted enzyme related to lactoylglutathione lyase
MPPVVQSVIATTYVRDIDRSRAFYELLGFAEQNNGKSDAGAWSFMAQDRHMILLASTRAPLGIPPLPLLFYIHVEDLSATMGVLSAAGVRAVVTGHPPHALGGEAKLLDPDGNTLLVAQRDRSESQPPPVEGEDPSTMFSVLQEAAAQVEARGGTTAPCAVSDLAGQPCGKRAEVKLADSGGGSAWVCLPHADEILVTVPGAFIADTGVLGIAGFLSRLHR